MIEAQAKKNWMPISFTCFLPLEAYCYDSCFVLGIPFLITMPVRTTIQIHKCGVVRYRSQEGYHFRRSLHRKTPVVLDIIQLKYQVSCYDSCFSPTILASVLGISFHLSFLMSKYTIRTIEFQPCYRLLFSFIIFTGCCFDSSHRRWLL
jgi:hypothetical protein